MSTGPIKTLPVSEPVEPDTDSETAIAFGARLKRAYDEGMASGEGSELDRDDFLAELNAEFAKRA